MSLKPLHLVILLCLACTNEQQQPEGSPVNVDGYLLGRHDSSVLNAIESTAFGKFFHEDSTGWRIKLREPLFETGVDSVYFIQTSGSVMLLLARTRYKPVIFLAVDTSGRQENYEYLGAEMVSMAASVTPDSTTLNVHIYEAGPLDFKPYDGTCRITASHKHIGFTVKCDED